MYLISANYRDRKSPFKYLIRKSGEPESMARPCKRVEARDGYFGCAPDLCSCEQVLFAKHAVGFEFESEATAELQPVKFTRDGFIDRTTGENISGVALQTIVLDESGARAAYAKPKAAEETRAADKPARGNVSLEFFMSVQMSEVAARVLSKYAQTLVEGSGTRPEQSDPLLVSNPSPSPDATYWQEVRRRMLGRMPVTEIKYSEGSIDSDQNGQKRPAAETNQVIRLGPATRRFGKSRSLLEFASTMEPTRIG